MDDQERPFLSNRSAAEAVTSAWQLVFTENEGDDNAIDELLRYSTTGNFEDDWLVSFEAFHARSSGGRPAIDRRSTGGADPGHHQNLRIPMAMFYNFETGHLQNLQNI